MKKTIISVTTIGLVLITSISPINAFNTKEESIELEMLSKPHLYAIPFANIYVDDDADPGWYYATHVKTIQEGINVAKNGDIVFVFSGTYAENVVINVSITLKGEDRNTTIIDGKRLDSTILIEASSVNITRFTVQNSGIGIFYAGIKGINVENILISNCTILNNNKGFKLGPCSNISINNCDINSNKNGGGLIYVYSNIEIDSCHIRNNGAIDGYDFNGILFYKKSFQQSNIKITNCNISENIGDGIFIYNGGENINIYNNAINNNGYSGVVINDGVNVDIHHNTIIENSNNGILFSSGIYGSGGFSSDVYIYNNYILQNGCNEYIYTGIKLQGCYDCVVIKNNIISANTPYSIYLRDCTGNKITENNFINSFKVYSASFGYDSLVQSNIWSKNYWDRPRILAKIIPGMIFSKNRNVHWIEFDWLPVQKPYKI